MKRLNATDKIVPVVLNIDDHTQLKVAAATARMTLASYIRARLFSPSPAVPSLVAQPRPKASIIPSSVVMRKSGPEPTVEHHDASSPPPRGGRSVTTPPEHEALDPFLADAFGGRPPPFLGPLPAVDEA